MYHKHAMKANDRSRRCCKCQHLHHSWNYMISAYGPLTRYVKLRVAHAPGMPGTFSPPPRVSDPGMHHGTCVTHVPWCMPGSLTSGFLWSRWWGRRSLHSRRMRNLQFYVSGKRPMAHWHKQTPFCIFIMPLLQRVLWISSYVWNALLWLIRRSGAIRGRPYKYYYRTIFVHEPCLIACK